MTKVSYRHSRAVSGLGLQKYFSKMPQKPYETREAVIRDDYGKVLEKISGAIFPVNWSLNASNTVATKYFRREGVPSTGRELDIRQLAARVADTIGEWGVRQGYFDESEKEILRDELVAATINQYASFNSPVWFNLGLDRYGLNQKSDNFYVDMDGKVKPVKNIHEHPQISACFIVSPKDSIEDMMQVAAVTSSKVFKGGSGIGGDWSAVRSAGEPVSGGGYASGAGRFMDVQDACARVIKSGGKTRRAATMQSLGVWHPDLTDTLRHKYKEEVKARVLIKAGSPGNWESHTIQDLRAQNVNISIRTDDAFWTAYENNYPYQIRRVVGGKVLKEEDARKIAERIAFATHACGDPGIQYHTTINRWNTCKESGEIWAANPCAEFNWFNSACNLSSQNLMKYYRSAKKPEERFDLHSFRIGIDDYVTAQDIMVSNASYPTEEIAWNSHIFRPLGLGYANLGALIMSMGMSYDSDEARNLAAAITANMTAESYLQSARLAQRLGPFQEFGKNKDSMLEVLEMHRAALKEIPKTMHLEYLLSSAERTWAEAIKAGKAFGFRNAQVTLLAPTGTIGFMMDADTTGCEPAFQLKVYKETAGGGYMTIVNQTVPLALERLGYNGSDITKIVEHIEQRGTVEGCALIKDRDLPVFDCAVPGSGERYISPKGHIKMLAAIQPHLSGAISKTVNCPEDTTVAEIEDMFYQGWKSGLKALAIYRNASKVAQPLSTKKNSSVQIMSRGERESLPTPRIGITEKVKIGGIPLFIRTGEYREGRLGELFVDSLERGSEVNRLLHEAAVQFSEKLQYGVPLPEAIEIFGKSGQSQISGFTDHPYIKTARGIEGFLADWVKAHYLGDISGVPKNPEMRPLPWELRVYQNVPSLHLLPTVAGEKMYPGVPSLEETIEKVSGINFWKDDGLDTRRTVENIKKNRIWNGASNHIKSKQSSKLLGRICDKCGNIMIADGSCWKCPICKTSTGGCGGG